MSLTCTPGAVIHCELNLASIMQNFGVNSPNPMVHWTYIECGFRRSKKWEWTTEVDTWWGPIKGRRDSQVSLIKPKRKQVLVYRVERNEHFERGIHRQIFVDLFSSIEQQHSRAGELQGHVDDMRIAQAKEWWSKVMDNSSKKNLEPDPFSLPHSLPNPILQCSFPHSLHNHASEYHSWRIFFFADWNRWHRFYNNTAFKKTTLYVLAWPVISLESCRGRNSCWPFNQQCLHNLSWDYQHFQHF